MQKREQMQEKGRRGEEYEQQPGFSPAKRRTESQQGGQGRSARGFGAGPKMPEDMVTSPQNVGIDFNRGEDGMISGAKIGRFNIGFRRHPETGRIMGADILGGGGP